MDPDGLLEASARDMHAGVNRNLVIARIKRHQNDVRPSSYTLACFRAILACFQAILACFLAILALPQHKTHPQVHVSARDMHAGVSRNLVIARIKRHLNDV